jgi:hypothetical protein
MGLSGTPEKWFESRWGYRFPLFYKGFRNTFRIRATNVQQGSPLHFSG